MDGSSQIRQKRLICLITITRQYSAPREIFLIYRANHSPLILKSLEGLERLGENKTFGPDCVSGEILKLARLLDITMNNGTLPGDWERATVIPIHKGGRSIISHEL